MNSLVEAWQLLTTDPERISEASGQLTIFFQSDEPPDPDDFLSVESFQGAWIEWESNHQDLAQAIATINSARNFKIRVLDKQTLNTVFTELGWLPKQEAIAKFKDCCRSNNDPHLLIDLVQDIGGSVVRTSIP